MKKTMSVWICGILLLVSIISSCSAAEKTEISFVFPGTAGPERVWGEGMEEGFNKAYPNIKLTTMYVGWANVNEKVYPMAAAGNPPDLFWIETSRLKDLTSMGYLQPLDEWTQGWSDLQHLLPGVIQGGTVKGNLYLIATMVKIHTHGGVYNRKKLEKYWGPIETIRTWEDWIAAAQACNNQDYDNDGKVDTYGVIFSPDQMGTYQLIQCLQENNGHMILPDLLNLDLKKQWVEIFDWWQRIGEYRVPGADSMTYQDVFRAFGSELPVFVPSAGSYLFANVEPFAPGFFTDENVGIWTGPPGPSHEGIALPVNTVYGPVMFKDISQERKDAAWKFIAFHQTKENGAKFPGIMHLPARDDITVADILKHTFVDPPEKYEWYVKAYFDVVKNGSAPSYPSFNYGEVLQLQKVLYLDLVNKKITPEQAYYTMFNGLANIWGRE